mgnify:CR=1 FL=1
MYSFISDADVMNISGKNACIIDVTAPNANSPDNSMANLQCWK